MRVYLCASNEDIGGVRIMKKCKKYIIGLLVLFLAVTVYAVVSGNAKVQSQEDIIILFTNDVHCGIEENIGYAGLVQYKNWI